jgi:hypothetical protein
MIAWLIYVADQQHDGPDKRQEEKEFIAQSLMVVNDIQSPFVVLLSMKTSELVVGDRRYISCLTFRLHCIKSRDSIGGNKGVTLLNDRLLMRREIIITTMGLLVWTVALDLRVKMGV